MGALDLELGQIDARFASEVAEALLVDGAQGAGRQTDAHVALAFIPPQLAPLQVGKLALLGLDVGVVLANCWCLVGVFT